MSGFVNRKVLIWLVPVVTVGIAFFVTTNIPTLRHNTPLFLFLTAVLFSTWYGGWFCGILATGLSAVVTAWFFLPSHSLVIGGHEDLMRWMMFIVTAIMISSLHASRSRAEKELRDSRQRFALAVDSAHIGIWDYNLLTRKLWWSATLESIYGRTNGDFPPTYGQFFGCIHFDDQPLFNRAIMRTIDEGADYDIEHRILLPDNSVRWVNTRGRMFFNHNARAERIMGVVSDITARKRGEETQQVYQHNDLTPVA